MIPGLDGLRAIAFLFIFLFHARYFGGGWMGVQLFFVLSGYLITGILLDMKKSIPMKDYFIKFYGRRSLRIFPLYYFYLIVMGVLTTWLISINYRPSWMMLFKDQVKYAVFYVFNFYATTASHQYTHFLTHFWSLSIEEQFYIFWAPLIFLMPEKYYKKLFISLIVLGPALRIGTLLFYQSGTLSLLANSLAEVIYNIPTSHIDAFALGAYISRYSIPKAKEHLLILPWVIPAIGFTTQYIATGRIEDFSSLGYPLHMPNAYQFIWGYSILNYFFAVIIHAVSQHGTFVKLLEWTPLRSIWGKSHTAYMFITTPLSGLRSTLEILALCREMRSNHW